jgi:uridine kinase
MPVWSAQRAALLEQVADEIIVRRGESVLRVAIDGVDGAGKTTFADELAAVLERQGVRVIRSTTDCFHNPRSIRLRRGKLSPEGFYRDSHNLTSLKALLLDPLSANPPEPFRTAAFDEPSDSPVDVKLAQSAPGDVLVFDGLFLSRPELRQYWDYSIYVDGDERVASERIAIGSADFPPGVMAFWHLARWSLIMERYAGGQRLYLTECQPRLWAHAVVDNNDFRHPTVTRRAADTA